MDLNLVVIAGRLAGDPEVNTFGSGATLVRILVTVRSDEPRRRIDVLPVVMWDPADDEPVLDMKRGQGVWVAGSVQRRFWSADAGRTSRIEIVAHDIQPAKTESDASESDTDAPPVEVTASMRPDYGKLSASDRDGAQQAQDDANCDVAEMGADNGHD